MARDLIGIKGKINWKVFLGYMADSTEGMNEKYMNSVEQLRNMGVLVGEEDLGERGFGIYTHGILSACPRECGLNGKQLFFFNPEDAKAYAKAALKGQTAEKDYTIENVARRRGLLE